MAEKNSRAKSAMGGHGSKKSKSTHKPHEVHVRRGHSGGFVVRHSHKPSDTGEMPPDEEHVVPDMAALQQHMQDSMGDQPPAPATPPPDPNAPAAGPAPQAGPPAGAPPGM